MHSEIRPAVVDRSFRVTLPKEIREVLGVTIGDYVGFRVEEGRVVVAKARWEMEASGTGG